MFAEVRDFVPRVRGAGEDVADPGFAGADDVFFDFFAAGFGLEAGTEDGVAEAGAFWWG